MNAEDNNVRAQRPAVPAGKPGAKCSAPPEPPKSPEQSKKSDPDKVASVSGAAEAMPDLDQFNFMKW